MMSNLLSILCCLLLLGACTSQPTTKSNLLNNSTQSIIIAQFGHFFLYLPVYVAMDRGFFREEGLNVKLISTGGDEKTFAAVSSNNAQFGVSDPTFTAIARAQGQGGKVVASIVNGVPFWGVAFKKTIKPIKKHEDFSGLRIATCAAPSTCYTVIKQLLDNNSSPINATIVQSAPTGNMIAMAKAGQADIAIELEPAASIAVGQGGHIVCSLQREYGDFAITGLMVSDEYHKNHRKEIQGAVNALAKAMSFIYHDFEETIAIARREFPEVEEKTLRLALARSLNEHTIPSHPFLTKEAWNKAIALRKQVGDLKDNGNYEENVDMTFANAYTKSFSY